MTKKDTRLLNASWIDGFMVGAVVAVLFCLVLACAGISLLT